MNGLRRLNPAGLLLALGMLAGCATLPDHTQDQKVTALGDETIITWPSDQNHVYLKTTRANRRICRSPSPDVATSAAESGGLSLAGIGTGTESLSESSSQNSFGLGGRSPSVLIVREVMYRSCELTMNIDASDEKAEEIFFKTLDVLERLTSNQTGSGTTAGSALATTSDEFNNSLPNATSETGCEEDDTCDDDDE